MNKSTPQNNLLSGEIEENEIGEFYNGYLSYSRGKPLINQLKLSSDLLVNFLESLTEQDGHYSYADGKWTIKQVIGHMIDMEIIFDYRALAIARGEKVSLPGYEHNSYVENANFNTQSIKQLTGQYQAIRNYTIPMFESFSPDALMRTGTASNSPFTVRSLGYIIAGHEQHHIKVLREKYLPGLSGNFNL